MCSSDLPNATDTTRTGKNKKTGKKPDTPEPAPAPASAELVRYLQDDDGGPSPSRRVVLAWRRSFTRYEAIAALRNAIYACELPGVHRLTAQVAQKNSKPPETRMDAAQGAIKTGKICG